MQIASFDAWKWRELHRVVVRHCGVIMHTVPTGRHIKADHPVPDGYTTSPISMSRLSDKTVLIDPFEA